MSSQCGGQSPDGLEAWKQVVERGYKSYTAKNERSAYEGRTTRSWLPKQPDWTVARTAVWRSECP
jgi:hypothetical protein